MSNREYVKYQDIKFYCHPKYKYYLASRCGQILSLKRNKKRILKFHKLTNGYLGFRLFENNTYKDYFIHRYIYEVFKGEIPEGMHIDHFDFNRKNNSISNLQLLTPKENVRKSCCKKVISYDLENKEKIIFDSLTQVAEYHQISVMTVCYNCKKRNKITKSKRDGKKYKFSYL